MQGVRLVSTPPANSAGSASAGLPLSICAIEPLCTGNGMEGRGINGRDGCAVVPVKLSGHPGGVMSPITNAPRGRTVRRVALLSLFALPSLVVASRGIARAQTVRVDHHEPAMA